jgi:hypothetical protein
MKDMLFASGGFFLRRFLRFVGGALVELVGIAHVVLDVSFKNSPSFFPCNCCSWSSKDKKKMSQKMQNMQTRQNRESQKHGEIPQNKKQDACFQMCYHHCDTTFASRATETAFLSLTKQQQRALWTNHFYQCMLACEKTG